jgi:hypothetical protein
MPSEKVEVGFTLTGAAAPFLTLNDPVKGQLDNASWPLGGTVFVDITNDVNSYTITRGKNRELEGYQSGEAIVVLNNTRRYYDPLYTASPYYGNIVPKKEIRISTNNIVEFFGVVSDWNLDYAPGRLDTATVVADDAFVYLNNQTLSASTATVQLSGARINSVLDAIGYPATTRTIDAGNTTLGADVIPAEQNVLAYLKKIEQTELGSVFISKGGNVTFKSRNSVAPTSSAVLLADDGTGIPYQNLKVVYGSEQLANEIVVSSVVTGSTATASDTVSQSQYGVFNLSILDLLMNSNDDLVNMATFLTSKYANPEYRFESLDVRVNDLTTTQQNQMLSIELGDVVNVKFTPSNIPPAITQYAQVIRCDHAVDEFGNHYVSIGLATLDTSFLVLDDAVFGKLDENTLAF